MEQDIERILLPEERILSRIDQVARDVTQVYEGKAFTVVGVLKGSCVFVSDLIRRLPIPMELSFVSASSYGAGTESQELHLNFLPSDNEIDGKSILLVDDILDTGKTMHRLKSELLAMGAREVRTCVFLDKPSRRDVQFEADFRCFEIDNLFVVGYGLDFAGHYRNLPYVGALREEAFQRLQAQA